MTKYFAELSWYVTLNTVVPFKYVCSLCADKDTNFQKQVKAMLISSIEARLSSDSNSTLCFMDQYINQ